MLYFDANDIFDGGEGFDTLTVYAGSNASINFTDTSRFNGIDHIQLQNDSGSGDFSNTLTIDMASIAANTDTGFLRITSDQGADNVVVTDAHFDDYAGDVDIDGVTYQQYDTGTGAVLYIELGTKFNDYLVYRGASADETIIGTDSDDLFFAVDGVDTIDGGAGNDTFFLDADDTYVGGEGYDVLVTQEGDAIDLEITFANLNRFEGINHIQLNNFEGPAVANSLTFDMNNFHLFTDSDRTLYVTGDVGLDEVTVHNLDLSGHYQGLETVNGVNYEHYFFGGNRLYLQVGLNASSDPQASPDPINTGTSGGDNLTGSDDRDVVSALEGNDTVHAGGGNDEINGGAGNDTLHGELGDDTIRGGNDNDFIYGDEGADSLFGDAGVDTIEGGLGEDTIYGGAGGDILSGGDAVDTIYGDAGNDTINGDAGNDILHGGSGNDTLNGGAGTDTLSGGDQTDYLHGGDANDTLNGDGGNDFIYGDAGVDTLNGGVGNDTLNGGAEGDFLYGNEGNDRLHGGDGNDILIDADGNNKFYGDAGNDILDARASTGLASLPDQIAQILADNSDIFYNSTTGSFYKYVDQAVSYDAAVFAASNTFITNALNQDIAAHIVTIETGQENRFIQRSIDQNIWLGGSDAAQEGAWTWQHGSNAGVQFSNGSSGIGHIYRNWASGQPDNWDSGTGEGQDHMEMRASDGRWTDVNPYEQGATKAYVLEWSSNDLLINPVAVSTGNNTLDGGSGNDTLYGSRGNDVLKGGDGDDMLYSSSSGSVPTHITFDSSADIVSYAGNQDRQRDGFSITDDGAGLYLQGNTWKKTALDGGYTITEDTILSFEFRSTEQAELQEIGFDNDNNISNRGSIDFQLFGGQARTNSVSFYEYDGSGEWQQFEISVGAFGTGQYNYLTFINDNDQTQTYGNSFYRNISLREGGGGDPNTNQLDGGDGLDNLYGASGQDIFRFWEETAFNDIDVIHDFDSADGDTLDISHILAGYDVNDGNLDLYVELNAVSGLRVDTTGSGNFTASEQIASFSGTTNLDDALTMLGNGELLV